MFIRYTFLLFLFSIIISQNSIDVLSLNNGDLIKGQIIENSINNYVRVELMGGSIITYQYSEIKNITKEQISIESSENGSQTNQFSIKNNQNCYGDGVKTASNIDTNSAVLGGFVSGFGLGLIGMGISYAIVSLGNPHPDYIPGEYEGDCRNDYLRGYRKEALSKKRTSNLLGGAMGVLTIVLVYSSQY